MAKKPPQKKQDKGGGGHSSLAEAKLKLATFLKDNPPAEIIEADVGGDSSLRIVKAWGDRSLALAIDPDKIDTLSDALNSVKLSERLSAIWHKDSGDLEIIWTAHNLPKSQNEVANRSFNFELGGKSYVCEFGRSSPRLLTIAEHFVPLTMSPTFWRNLQSFSQYSRLPEERRKRVGLDEPRSFWIHNIKWNEEVFINTIYNLNFYLTYFDDRSPNIIIHDPHDASEKQIQRTRYIRGSFPTEIKGGELESNLLTFWASAYEERPMMSFLQYFRIIEYAATHFIDSSVKLELRKILMSPDLNSNITNSVEKIIGSVNITKLEDSQRFKAVIRHCVDPKLLWRDVSQHLSLFSKETKFDGGFSVRPLVSGDDKEATFCTRGIDSFADSARKIRNALSHGKDLETSGVITPTTRNVKLLQPWLHLMATAAGEVVLYKDAT
ncbi:hypothetical protein ACWGM0_07920 [Sphingomonas bisphenolicum]